MLDKTTILNKGEQPFTPTTETCFLLHNNHLLPIGARTFCEWPLFIASREKSNGGLPLEDNGRLVSKDPSGLLSALVTFYKQSINRKSAHQPKSRTTSLTDCVYFTDFARAHVSFCALPSSRGRDTRPDIQYYDFLSPACFWARLPNRKMLSGVPIWWVQTIHLFLELIERFGNAEHLKCGRVNNTEYYRVRVGALPLKPAALWVTRLRDMLMRVRDNHIGHPSAQRKTFTFRQVKHRSQRDCTSGCFSAIAYVRAYYERLTEAILSKGGTNHIGSIIYTRYS